MEADKNSKKDRAKNVSGKTVIISHRYKYLFVEVPRTGSTAISAELTRFYDGEEIHTKHAYYSTFLQNATDAERKYRVISGIRHPLDDVVSVYRKYSTKNRGYYAGNRRNMRKHARINNSNMSFSDYLRTFHRLPYDHWTSTYHRRFDHIIRFEKIQEDFAEALKLVGASQVRPLPVKNQTQRDRNFATYFDSGDIEYAAKIFGPYMEKWGYQFPDAWGNVEIPHSAKMLFRALGPTRRFYWNHIRQNDSIVGRTFRKLILNE